MLYTNLSVYAKRNKLTDSQTMFSLRSKRYCAYQHKWKGGSLPKPLMGSPSAKQLALPWTQGFASHPTKKRTGLFPVLFFGGLGRVKYAPRKPNIIRAPEKILHGKRFLGKRRSPPSVVLFAVANCWRKAVLRRGGDAETCTPVLNDEEKSSTYLSNN